MPHNPVQFFALTSLLIACISLGYGLFLSVLKSLKRKTASLARFNRRKRAMQAADLFSLAFGMWYMWALFADGYISKAMSWCVEKNCPFLGLPIILFFYLQIPITQWFYYDVILLPFKFPDVYSKEFEKIQKEMGLR